MHCPMAALLVSSWPAIRGHGACTQEAHGEAALHGGWWWASVEAASQDKNSNAKTAAGERQMKSPICDMLGIDFPLLAFSHCVTSLLP
jgi:hypothetical protein